MSFPIFDDKGNSNGAIEVLNSKKSNFTSEDTKPLLTRFAKYISLLFYTSDLLKV